MLLGTINLVGSIWEIKTSNKEKIAEGGPPPCVCEPAADAETKSGSASDS